MMTVDTFPSSSKCFVLGHNSFSQWACWVQLPSIDEILHIDSGICMKLNGSPVCTEWSPLVCAKTCLTSQAKYSQHYDHDTWIRTSVREFSILNSCKPTFVPQIQINHHHNCYCNSTDSCHVQCLASCILTLVVTNISIFYATVFWQYSGKSYLLPLTNYMYEYIGIHWYNYINIYTKCYIHKVLSTILELWAQTYYNKKQLVKNKV